MPTRLSPAVLRALEWLLVLGCVALGTWVRVWVPLHQPNFQRERPEGMFRSDPGLLFYFVERFVESHGLPPADLRADPRVEHPREVDLLTLDTVGQEFLIAWTRPLTEGALPLHLHALGVMALVASLSVVGVFLLTRELTRSPWWAAAAALLFTFIPGNYRTLGLILMREDLSLPLFALHLAFFARAARTQALRDVVVCGLAAVASLATWHGIHFVFTMEAACLAAWFLRTGETPFAARRAWVALALVVVGAVVVPVLAHTSFALSWPCALPAGLVVAAQVAQRAPGRAWPPRLAAFATWAALGALHKAMTFLAGGDDYRHVWQLLAAKVATLGVRPADPDALPFDVRLMWQGPFETLTATGARTLLGAVLVPLAALLVLGAVGWVRRRGSVPVLVLLAFTGAALLGAWLIVRVEAMVALLLPATLAVAGASWARARWAAAGYGALLAWQLVTFVTFVRHCDITWLQPPHVRAEYQRLLAALPGLVPPGEAIASDPVDSTTLLAHTRHPIVLQPKWEQYESREPIADFLQGFFQESPERFRALLLEKYRTRYLLIDRRILWVNFRYAGGLPETQPSPNPGTSAEVFMSEDQATLEQVPGYRLLYRSRDSNGQPAHGEADLLRLYELSPEPVPPPERSGP
ncbi:MAG: hypothetical protein K1X89_10865 [Myxococcaceae bacterium]|nr:hypothetical protein [Myxococcaceae bacterium]